VAVDEALVNGIRQTEELNAVVVPLATWRRIVEFLEDRGDHHQTVADNLSALLEEKVALQARIEELEAIEQTYHRMSDYYKRGVELVLTEVLAEPIQACDTFAGRVLQAQQEATDGRWKWELQKLYPGIPYNFIDVLTKQLQLPSPLEMPRDDAS
jgi:hypothetical protein